MKLVGAFLLASALPALSLGSVTGDIQMSSGDISEMPEYWSGTNCRFGFICYSEADPDNPMLFEPTISKYEIWVGGQLTAHWEKGPRDPYLFWIGSEVVFDSSHFPHGTPLDIRVKVWGSDGFFESIAPTRPVINRSRMLVQKDFLSGGTGPYPEHIQMQNVHTGAQYQTSAHFDNTWTKADLRNDVMMSTIFSVQTHGSNGSPNFPGARITDNNHLPDHGNDPIGEAWRFYALKTHAPVYSAEAARIEAIGEGPTPANDALPPYNDGEPVLTIAFVNSCHTGTTNAFKNGLTWPHGTRYDPNPMTGDVNEAVVSFEPSAFFAESRYAELTFWQSLLVSKKTVHAARLDAIAVYNTWVPEINKTRPADMEKSVIIGIADMRVFGDLQAKGKSVYLGDPSQWWR